MAQTGARRDFTAMERRRLEAAQLLQKGVWPAEVARRLGVSRQSVHRWQQRLGQEGRRALRKAARAGRPPKLTAADRRTLARALKAGPETQGHPTGLWTLKRVAQLIESQFGVRYSQPRVWQLLRQLGWSCQRPTGQARERDEAAIRRWKRTVWPTLKKTPRRKAGPSSSLTNRA